MLILVVLLIGILLVSVFFPRLNPGLLALTSTFFLAPYLLQKSPSEAINILFPSHLFLTLLGVTFFFGCLNSSGLLDTLLLRIVARFAQAPRSVPFVVFMVVALFTALGMGNIASVALIAPIAIRLADQLKFSKTLMSILVVGAANAASFSPLTLPGILIDTFIHSNRVLSGKTAPDLLQWIIFTSVFAGITFVSAVGFFILGGFEWWKVHKGSQISQLRDNLPKQTNELTVQQRKASRISLMLLTLFLLASLLALQPLQNSLPENFLWIPKRFSEIGTIGWIGVLLLLSFKAADLEESIQRIPWSTILLVCGMSTYIELINHIGLATQLVATLKQNIALQWLTPLVTAASALVSSFTSSVGVALPLFLPLVESLSVGMDESVLIALLISICLGSHLVDASPLSTLGALCMAQVSNPNERTTLYRSLLFWGIAMVPVSAIAGWIVALILG